MLLPQLSCSSLDSVTGKGLPITPKELRIMFYCPGIETRSSQCLWWTQRSLVGRTGLGLTGWEHVFVLLTLS